MNKKILMAVCISVGLAACATTQNYQSTVRSWIGARDRSVYQVWGYPDSVEKLPQGHHLLVYHYHDQGTFPTTSYPGATNVVTQGGETQVYNTAPFTTGGGTYNLNCTTWFELNSHNIVVQATYRGNACTATSGFEHSKMNPNRAFIH